jgi:hypothetical protein
MYPALGLAGSCPHSVLGRLRARPRAEKAWPPVCRMRNWAKGSGSAGCLAAGQTHRRALETNSCALSLAQQHAALPHRTRQPGLISTPETPHSQPMPTPEASFRLGKKHQ